jgi:RNA polymerase sigma-70 factor (ECF subfamily)
MKEPIAQLEALYCEHGKAILSYLQRRFSQTQAAEDLLQETFVRALRDVKRLDQLASPRAWLFTIARNLGMTALRKKRLASELPAQVSARAESDIDPRVDLMRDAIARLPEPQREVLALRLRDDLSYEEIAAVLAIPIGTVRSRMHHAVKRLRESLNDGP